MLSNQKGSVRKRLNVKLTTQNNTETRRNSEITNFTVESENADHEHTNLENTDLENTDFENHKVFGHKKTDRKSYFNRSSSLNTEKTKNNGKYQKLVSTCSLDDTYETGFSDGGFNESENADSTSVHSIEKIRIEPRLIVQKNFKSKVNWNKVAKLSKLNGPDNPSGKNKGNESRKEDTTESDGFEKLAVRSFNNIQVESKSDSVFDYENSQRSGSKFDSRSELANASEKLNESKSGISVSEKRQKFVRQSSITSAFQLEPPTPKTEKSSSLSPKTPKHGAESKPLWEKTQNNERSDGARSSSISSSIGSGETPRHSC